MQTAASPNLPRPRPVLRFAVAAALIAFVIPLLPLYGGDGTEFVFSLGFPLRVVIEFLLGHWTHALVVAAGIVLLRRGDAAVAGGVFAAVSLGLTITIATQIIVTAPHFGRWQTVVILMLETLQAILLVIAGARAIGASRPEGVDG